ncbi:PspC domain-containing protein [Sphingomonas sp.]|uniref:PspC domain-containing protein n=1 Tax=Sphingomonas sp. TaxID=28214 RepID=UPI003B3B4EA3
MIRDAKNGLVSEGGMLLGTCSIISERTGLAPVVVRGAMIVAACLWFKLTVLLYCLGAVVHRLRR